MCSPARSFPIWRLVALVVLGLVLVPVECSAAMGPHSVFTDPAAMAAPQGVSARLGHAASVVEVGAEAEAETHAPGGHGAAAPQPALSNLGLVSGEPPSAPTTADIDAVFGAVLASYAPSSSGRSAPKADHTPSQPVPAPERGPDRPPP